MARQGNTTAVGLGYTHQRDRKQAITAMPDGTPCPLCGKPMRKTPAANWDGRPLHYDHVIPRAIARGTKGPMRLTHATCNITAGTRLGNQLRRGRRTPRRAAYTRW